MNATFRSLFTFLVIFLGALFPLSILAQAWQWGHAAGNGQQFSRFTEARVDGSGDFILSGNVRDTSVFGNDTVFVPASSNSTSFFIAKFDSLRNPLWAVGTDISSNPTSHTLGIVVDDNDNVYAIGYFWGSIVFGNDTLTASSGSTNFLVKISPSGEVLWHYSLQSGSLEDIVYHQGRVYVSGNVGGIEVWDGVSIGVAGSGSDVFVASVDTSGTVHGAYTIAENTNAVGFQLQLDSLGNIYIAGRTQNQFELGNDTIFANGPNELWLAKLDSAGNGLWVKSLGSYTVIRTDQINLTVDMHGRATFAYEFHFGNTIVIDDSTIVPPGSGYFHMSNFLPNGALSWVKVVGGSVSNDPHSITADAAGNIYVGGQAGYPINFGDTSFDFAGASWEGFVAKMDALGNTKWAIPSAGNQTFFTNIDVVDSNNLLVAGVFLAPAIYLGNDTLIPEGSRSNFFAYLQTEGCDIANPSATVTAICGSDSAQLTASPGYASYEWSNGLTGSAVDITEEGQYYLVATDTAGCRAASQVVEVSFDSLSLDISSTTSLGFCPGDSVLLSGTSGFDSYSWSNGDTGPSTSIDQPGTISLTAFKDGCPFSDSVIVSAFAAPSLVIDSVSHISCFGVDDGYASAAVSGGSGTISYAWSSGSSISSASSLMASTYTVIATDSNGCSASDQVTILEPALLTATITAQTAVSCFGANDAQATAVGAGGSGAISYQWSNGDTTATAGALSGTSYVVTVTDASGCTATAQTTISEPSELMVSLSVPVPISCFGANDGSVAATATGGSGTIQYLWDDGSTGTVISSLLADMYSVIVTDSIGCADTAQVMLQEPPELLASISGQTDITCFGLTDGTATASVTGGTGSVDFLWSNGSVVSSAIGLPAATHTLTVTDANGCTDTVQVSIVEPSAVSVIISSQTDVSCFGGNDGMATASGSGGTGTILYSWSSGGMASTASALSAMTYTVTATDVNGCTASEQVLITEPSAIDLLLNVQSHVSCFGAMDGEAVAAASGGTGSLSYLWSNSDTAAMASGLLAGIYTVTVTDSNNCSSSDQLVIDEPSELIVSIGPVESVSCFGGADGSAQVSASGGTAPVLFLWSNGSATSQITALPAGIYAVTATDSNGCVATDTVDIVQPEALTSSILVTNANCEDDSDGALDATISGGTLPYTYEWSNGDSTAQLSGLSVGMYTLILTDSNGCSLQDSAEVMFDFESPVIDLPDTSFFCEWLGITLDAGNPGSQFSWSSGETTQLLHVTAAGTYTVTVTNSNGCEEEDVAVVIEDTCLGVGQYSDLQLLKLFPNPSNGLFYLSSPTPVEVADVQVFSISGQWIQTEQWLGGYEYQSLSSLSSGVYFVWVTSGDEELARFRLVVQ